MFHSKSNLCFFVFKVELLLLKFIRLSSGRSQNNFCERLDWTDERKTANASYLIIKLFTKDTYPINVLPKICYYLPW